MQHVVNLVIALAAREVTSAIELVAPTFTWTDPDGSPVLDFTALAARLPQRPEVTHLTITNTMSHGKHGMAEGAMTFADGDAVHFCAVAQFTSTAKTALISAVHFYFWTPAVASA